MHVYTQVWTLEEAFDYEGHQLLGVFASMAEAEAVRDFHLNGKPETNPKYIIKPWVLTVQGTEV